MFKHYTMNQVVLPLDLEIKLQENDIAYTVHELVESIPDEAFAVLASNWPPSLSPTDDDEGYFMRLFAIRLLWSKNRSVIKRQYPDDVVGSRT